MTTTKELNNLIAKAEKMGADITVVWNEEDGRKLHESVAVKGLKGCGPFPMSPIAAAERLRELTA